MVGGIIYVAGGHDARYTIQDSMVRYDPSSNTWTTLSSMSECRFSQAVFALDGCVYAAGGHQSTVEKYEPACDRWSAAPSVTVPRFFFQGAGLESEAKCVRHNDSASVKVAPIVVRSFKDQILYSSFI